MNQSKICTLMYHDVYRISDHESGFNIESNYQYKLSERNFEEQISAISSYMMNQKIDKNYVHLSFDDGGISSYTVIMPIIEKYGFKGLFFIPTKYIGKEGFLNEFMIKEMANRGHHIGGHSHSHGQRMNDWTYDNLKEDWSTCINTLSQIIGKTCVYASLPNGFISKTILQILKEIGIKYLYTSEPSEVLKMDGNMEIMGRYGIKDTLNVQDVVNVTFKESCKRRIRRKKAMLDIAKSLMGDYYINFREFLFRIKKMTIK